MRLHGVALLGLFSILGFACSSADTGQGTGGKGGSAGGGGSGATGGAGGSGGGGSGGGGSGGGGSGGGGSGGSAGSGGSGGTAPDGGTGDAMPAAMGDCTPELPKSIFCDPMVKMPKSIKDLGLFPSAPDLSKHPASMLEYVPDPPLWSDWMEKQRFMVLPAGKRIDNSNPKEWIFPVGTVFVKTFFDDTGAGGAPRPIETRFVRQVGVKGDAVPYEFYLYKWNDTSTDATLVVDDANGDINQDAMVNITIKHMEGGKPLMVAGGAPFPHTLPSRQACGDCHEQSGKMGQTIIGFDEVRLNSKFTAASTKTQLQEFADKGIFMKAPPATPTTIVDTSNDMGRLLRIKRFVFGNCVHCHNGGEVVDFHPEVFVKNTINQMTDAQSVVPPAGWRRVVPGKPDMSVLYVQVRRTPLPPPTGNGTMNRLRPMPPVGVTDVAADQEAVNDIRDWILSLPAK
jgi:hypothetical protein